MFSRALSGKAFSAQIRSKCPDRIATGTSRRISPLSSWPPSFWCSLRGSLLVLGGDESLERFGEPRQGNMDSRVDKALSQRHIFAILMVRVSTAVGALVGVGFECEEALSTTKEQPVCIGKEATRKRSSSISQGYWQLFDLELKD